MDIRPMKLAVIVNPQAPPPKPNHLQMKEQAALSSTLIGLTLPVMAAPGTKSMTRQDALFMDT